uniref:Cap-specific mRNA (nucleoside-2'-O-)-methyltransferase 1 n=1 Tax=Schistosoma haematobium TaxID=6185 RepID=A0A095A406_SCHHA
MSDERSMKKAEKHKLSDPLDDVAWKIMRKMGYEHGQGLGVNAHGVVEPVALSKQKGRSGLGSVRTTSSSDKKIESFSGELYQSSNPNLVWHEGCDDDYTTADGDRTWSWSMEGGPSINSLLELNSLIISPDEPEALGPPIEELDNEDKFCSIHLVQEVLNYKNQLDYLSKLNVTKSHERCNPYELIKKGIFMNRAAMKMANIDSIFNGMFTTAAPKDDVLYFADICAGPGGFSEYTLWRRCNAPYHIHSSNESKRLNNTLSPSHHSNMNDKLLGDTTESVDHNSPTNNTSTTSEKQQPLLSAKGFGLTLTGHCDFRENDFLAGPKEAFMAHYGPGRDGDVTKWSNLASFASFIGRSTNNAGVHILMADGGFDVSSQYNLQEVMSKQLYLCQCLCALINLRPVCKNLRSSLNTMAGCVPAPKSSSSMTSHSDSTDQKSSFRQKTRKFPGQQQQTTTTNGIVVDDVEASKKFGILTDMKQSGSLGLVINHFLQVNEKLNQIKTNQSVSSSSSINPKLDVLRICHTEIIEQDEKFMQFIQGMNEDENLTSLNTLPSEYRANIRLTPFTNANLNNLDILYHSRIALVCGNPSITSTSEPAQTMFIYSHGSAVTDTYCTVDGDQWNRLDQVIPRLNPRLPPSTLIWGQPFYEYAVKFTFLICLSILTSEQLIFALHTEMITIAMELAEQMTNVINFPDMTSSNVRVPPFLKLSEIVDYVKKLPLLPCKDSPTLVPMHCLSDGFTFQPHSLLLVQHMTDNWTEEISRSTGKVYYFNRVKSESTFDLPESEHLSFT